MSISELQQCFICPFFFSLSLSLSHTDRARAREIHWGGESGQPNASRCIGTAGPPIFSYLLAAINHASKPSCMQLFHGLFDHFHCCRISQRSIWLTLTCCEYCVFKNGLFLKPLLGHKKKVTAKRGCTHCCWTTFSFEYSTRWCCIVTINFFNDLIYFLAKY